MNTHRHKSFVQIMRLPHAADLPLPACGAIEAAIFKSLGVITGVPDLLLIYCGKIYALKLKAAKGGRLSPTQIRTQEQMRQAGAIVATATGIDEALGQLELWGLIRGNVAVS